MIREMRHRSGNLFSQLLALFSQTARTSKSIADLTTKYQARVLAMANAHPTVLAVTAEVTRANDEDGVALVIEGLLSR